MEQETNTTEIMDKDFVKLSDVIANPLIKVYQAGQLGLVFIFIGLLLTIFAQVNSEGKYSTITFVYSTR